MRLLHGYIFRWFQRNHDVIGQKTVIIPVSQDFFQYLLDALVFNVDRNAFLQIDLVVHEEKSKIAGTLYLFKNVQDRGILHLQTQLLILTVALRGNCPKANG